MQGTLWAIVSTSFTACLGVLLVSAGIFGYFKGPANSWERILFIAGGLLLFTPGFFTDSVGVILAALGLLSQFIRRKKSRAVAIA